jgi:hypothetical protein
MYKLTVPTSVGNLTLPVLGGSLTLANKDSKIHVVDYEAGSTSLLYSTAEIMTWATIGSKNVILLYGNNGELHETAIKFQGTAPRVTVVSGTAKIKQQTLSGSALALQFTTDGQTVVQVGNNTLLYILGRASFLINLTPPK